MRLQHLAWVALYLPLLALVVYYPSRNLLICGGSVAILTFAVFFVRALVHRKNSPDPVPFEIHLCCFGVVCAISGAALLCAPKIYVDNYSGMELTIERNGGEWIRVPNGSSLWVLLRFGTHELVVRDLQGVQRDALTWRLSFGDRYVMNLLGGMKYYAGQARYENGKLVEFPYGPCREFQDSWFEVHGAYGDPSPTHSSKNVVVQNHIWRGRVK